MKEAIYYLTKVYQAKIDRYLAIVSAIEISDSKRKKVLAIELEKVASENKILDAVITDLLRTYPKEYVNDFKKGDAENLEIE